MKAKNLLFILLFPFMIMADNVFEETNLKNHVSDKNIAIKEALDLAYENNKSITSGKNADYIPILAEVPSDLFAIVVVTVDGDVFVKGDIDFSFSIQSISKVFLLASIIEVSGQEEVVNKIGAGVLNQSYGEKRSPCGCVHRDDTPLTMETLGHRLITVHIHVFHR